jgi:hypothetical protein
MGRLCCLAWPPFRCLVLHNSPSGHNNPNNPKNPASEMLSSLMLCCRSVLTDLLPGVLENNPNKPKNRKQVCYDSGVYHCCKCNRVSKGCYGVRGLRAYTGRLMLSCRSVVTNSLFNCLRPAHPMYI